jgi:sodium/hydrogen exchanger-like protein 3
MKNYVERNITSKSQTTLKYAMKMLSGSSETIIFMFLGVATIHDKHDWNWAFVTLTIAFCTIFRVIGEKLGEKRLIFLRMYKLTEKGLEKINDKRIVPD